MLYLLSKIFKTLFAPANILCLLLLVAGITCILPSKRARVFGQRLCFIVALLTLFIAIFPMGHWGVQKLENMFPLEIPERVDGIILLAGGEDPALTASRSEISIHESAPRYIKFAEMARKYPNARLAFIGGHSSPKSQGILTNADVARMAFDSLGIQQERIIYEDKSHNTFENATFGAELIKPKPEEKWLIITSAAHMPRSILTFRKAGWNVFPIPTDYNTSSEPPRLIGFSLLGHLNVLNTVFYEYSGLLIYWIMGRIDWPWS